jgi:2-enoate reductase
VEALDKILAIGAPLCHANADMLKELIPFNDIDVITNAKATAFKNSALTLDDNRKISCDSVVLCVGYKEENALFEELQFDVPEIYLLGDARKVANIMAAIWDAFEVANHI